MNWVLKLQEMEQELEEERSKKILEIIARHNIDPDWAIEHKHALNELFMAGQMSAIERINYYRSVNNEQN